MTLSPALCGQLPYQTVRIRCTRRPALHPPKPTAHAHTFPTEPVAWPELSAPCQVDLDSVVDWRFAWASSMFSAAVALSSGHIVFAPWHARQVGVFEVATSAFGRVAMRSTPSSDSDVSAPKLCENKPCTRFSLGSMSGGTLGFGGASVAGDGTVVFAPSDAAGVGVWSFSPADVTYFTCKTDTPVAFFVAGSGA